MRVRRARPVLRFLWGRFHTTPRAWPRIPLPNRPDLTEPGRSGLGLIPRSPARTVTAHSFDSTVNRRKLCRQGSFRTESPIFPVFKLTAANSRKGKEEVGKSPQN